ncbi:MAG: hypothetical protein ACKO6R_06940 [Burkholderiaceae bacterium]
MRDVSYYIKRVGPWLILAGLIVSAFLFWPGRDSPSPEASVAGDRRGDECTQVRTGAAGRHVMTTQRGLSYVVITPTDYSAKYRYGLLVLFPPAGYSRHAAERFYRITQRATAAGYVVALSDALPLSSHAMRAQADVVNEVAERWCVDAARVVLAGHSDGGLMAQGTVIKSYLPATMTVHVVSSAAGIQQQDLAIEHCPSPRRVTLLHPAHDERFPGYGWGVAQWWAKCFACMPMMNEPSAGQCIEAQACALSSSVRFCKTSVSHAQYPPELGEQLHQVMQRRAGSSSRIDAVD